MLNHHRVGSVKRLQTESISIRLGWGHHVQCYGSLPRRFTGPPAPSLTSGIFTSVQVLRADRAAFLYMSERLTTLKRNAIGELPLDTLLPSVLIQPTVAFHLLPLPGSASKASSSSKAPATERKGQEHRPDLSQRTKAEEKANQRRVSEDPMSPLLSLGRPLRHHKRKDCAGVSICQTDAMQPNQVKPVPKGCMFVPSQGASSTIRYKIIVEPSLVYLFTYVLQCNISSYVTFWLKTQVSIHLTYGDLAYLQKKQQNNIAK